MNFILTDTGLFLILFLVPVVTMILIIAAFWGGCENEKDTIKNTLLETGKYRLNKHYVINGRVDKELKEE
ncbi:unnamed protein product [marine sediment metagenome]|uniref:Uncharacterized protein n=1 Tax=marine sediment metagenome TaxID=412755 RepID=X0VH63_9ZZZZ